MPSPLQRPLPLAVPAYRPLVGMDGAKHLLDLNEDYILGLIHDRALSYAWDIGIGVDRCCVRLLRASIDHYIQHGSRPHPLTERQVLSLILPPGHTKPFLTNPEVQRGLNCVGDHVLHLLAAGRLALQPGTTYSRGPAGSALVSVPSFENFLRNARL